MNDSNNSRIRPATAGHFFNRPTIKPAIKLAIKPAETAQRALDDEAKPAAPVRDPLQMAAYQTSAALAGGPAVRSRPIIMPSMHAEVTQPAEHAEQIEADEASNVAEPAVSVSEEAPTKQAGREEQQAEEKRAGQVEPASVPSVSAVLATAVPGRSPEWVRPKIKPAIRMAVQQPLERAGQIEQKEVTQVSEPVMPKVEHEPSEQDDGAVQPAMALDVTPGTVVIDLPEPDKESIPSALVGAPVAVAIEDAFRPYVLGDFQVGEDCLTFDDGDEVVRITATQVYVAFLCGETSGKGCGFCLSWKTRGGKQCTKVIPMTRVVADWNNLLGELGDEGLFVLSPRHFKGYLLEACSRAELPEVRLIPEIGFIPLNPEDPLGLYGYMTHSGAIMPAESQLELVNADSLRYRPPFEHPALGAYGASGTHAQWKEGVAPAEGNVLVVFCTCAVLASVMLKVSGGENCGFHLHGLSSSGKSTAGQVGMSVLGCAADPQSSSKPTTFGSWSATDNGRELMAACASGAAMFLDELDSTPKGTSITIYPLMNGSGKVRMRGAGGMSTQHFWRLLVLSTGEVSLYERIMREPQREAMLGELLRFLDIPVDNLPRDTSLSVEQAQALAQNLKRRSGEVYGTACVAFVRSLFATYGTLGELRDALLEAIEVAHGELCTHLAARRPLRAAHKRAVRHFALVLAVSRWAADGVLPFSMAAVERAVFAMAEAWFDNFPSLTEEDRLLDSVRAYLREQRDNVVCTATASEAEQRGRVPKILLHDGRLYLAPDCFHQACGELPVVKAGKVLERLGVLHRHGGEGQKVKMTVWPSLFRNLRYYALDAARLLGERELAELVGGVVGQPPSVLDEGEDGLGPVPRF